MHEKIRRARVDKKTNKIWTTDISGKRGVFKAEFDVEEPGSDIWRAALRGVRNTSSYRDALLVGHELLSQEAQKVNAREIDQHTTNLNSYLAQLEPANRLRI